MMKNRREIHRMPERKIKATGLNKFTHGQDPLNF